MSLDCSAREGLGHIKVRAIACHAKAMRTNLAAMTQIAPSYDSLFSSRSFRYIRFPSETKRLQLRATNHVMRRPYLVPRLVRREIPVVWSADSETLGSRPNQATTLSTVRNQKTVTATTYLPGLFLGAVILYMGILDGLQLPSGVFLHSVVDRVVEPVAGVAVSLLPNWGVFLVGLGVIWFSFTLFDRCLPQMTLKESHLEWMSRLVYRPWVTFALGALVTMISMSVSLSLAILVPLSAQGFVRRENVIPYIMGANITTFIDTLLAAVLLDNPPAFTIVLV
jgi:hypothetical protein